MSVKHPAEILFESGLARVGAANGTFYIRDPYWTGDLRLVYMPGVSIREPMYGFLIPDTAKRLVTSGDDEIWLATDSDWRRFEEQDVPRHILKRYPFFGTFSHRESILTSARFIKRSDRDIEAVLFVNFRERHPDPPLSLRKELRDLFDVMVQCIPSIRRNITNTYPFPVTELTRILRPIESLSSIHHGTTSPLLSIYLEKVLLAAMDAFRISPETGFGTVHLYDASTRSLRLAAFKGLVSDELLSKSEEHAVDSPEGVISWVALKKRAVLITDLARSPFRSVHIPLQQNTVVELAVPMMAGNELLGVFNIESEERIEYHSAVDLVRVVWYAANQAAIAARLSQEAGHAFEQAAAAKRYASASTELLRICSQTSTRQDRLRPLDPVAELASKFLKANSCDIWKFEKNQRQFRGVGADYPAFQPQSPPREDGFSHFVHRHRVPVWIFNIVAVDNFDTLVWSDSKDTWCEPSQLGLSPPERVNVRLDDLGVAAELGVPVGGGEEPVGVIWVKFHKPGLPWPDRDVLESARGFAGQASLLITNLDRQDADDIAAQNSAIELLVTFLRHEITRPLEAVLVEMKEAKSSESFFKERDSWLSVLEFLHAFIEQLHWYRRGQKGRVQAVPKLRRERVCITDVVYRAVTLVDQVDSVPPCDVSAEDDKVAVDGDDLYLTIALFTLIHNARKFTPKHCKEEHVRIVVLKDSKSPSRVTIDIVNRGYCIPEDVKHRLGEEVGVRHDYEGVAAAGMGFGCYLCRLIISEHKGLVVWMDAPDGGVLCRVTLPLI